MKYIITKPKVGTVTVVSITVRVSLEHVALSHQLLFQMIYFDKPLHERKERKDEP